jgi:hypothetical protein
MFDGVNKALRISNALIYNIYIGLLARISGILKCIGAEDQVILAFVLKSR